MQLAYGADSVKVTSGKGLEEEGDPRIPELTIVEMTAAVEEAHKRGKIVIAHAMGASAVKNALSAGVDSICAWVLDRRGMRRNNGQERRLLGTYDSLSLSNCRGCRKVRNPLLSM